jgi:hypothetical protein
MAFLNQKERILDVVLTDKGRELLSKNLLEFSFYAFSDEGMNYSGSLSASLAQSSSFDDYVHRGLSFEANQRTSDNRYNDTTLKSFLFTVPSRSKVVPEFKTSIDTSIEGSALVGRAANVILKRSYFLNRISFRSRLSRRLRYPLAYILRASLEKKSLEERQSDYGLDQQVQQTVRKRYRRENIVGLPLAKDYIALKGNSALNVSTGLVTTIDQALQLHNDRAVEKEGKIVRVPRDMEIVTGLDSATITLQLKGSEGPAEITDGFLIEIFESGSDGRLVKLQEQDVEDPVGDEILQDGFESFLRVWTK